MNKRKTTVMLVALIDLAVFCPLVTAGDLQPPAAPSPTMKTLDEVEPRIPIPGSDTPVGPFNIVKSGSYYLTGDRNASTAGINILADNVTTDMMGYSLIGSGSGTYSGIVMVMSNRFNVEIHNGTVRNFGGGGIIDDNSATGKNHRVIAVRAVSNGGSGIFLTGQGHLVKGCTASNNGFFAFGDVWGIYLAGNSLVDQNTAFNNGIGANSATNMTLDVAGCVYGINVAP